MTVINTNIAALKAQYSMNKVNNALEKSMTQLSTGKRINSAADDAAGLSIANTMEAQLRGINMQIRNAQDGISLVQSVEGALEESSNILQRMNELATQASNSVFNADDRAALQAEVLQLQSELDRIAQDTEFNGQKILDGSYAGKQLNVGFGANGLIAIDIDDHSAASLSGAGLKDALAQLTETAANIAAGLNNQRAATSTVQAAVSKADSQAVSRSIAQINIGADNTQSVNVESVTKNIAATTSTHLGAVGTVAQVTQVTNNQVVTEDDTNKTYTVSGVAGAGAGTITVSIGGTTKVVTTAGSETAAATATLIADTINNDAAGLALEVRARVLDDGVTVQLSAANSIGVIADTSYARDNRVAGANSDAVGAVQAVSDVEGVDGQLEVKAYRVDGKVEQGDLFSLSIDGNTAVTYTVAQSDLAATESETKRNAIDSFVAKWNASSSALRTDVNAGEITLARVTNASGDDYITMTAQYPRPTSDAMTVTAFTLADRATSSLALGDLTAAATTAAASGVAATQELTLDTTDARVGDIFRINLDTLGNIDYTVKGTDIGATDAATLANIRQSIVDSFNSAEGYLTQSAAGGKVTASLSASDSSKIVLSGDDNTTGATFTAVVSAVAQIADTTENVTEVTDATILAGTHDDLIVSGEEPKAATRQLEITQQNASSGLADVGDVVTVEIEGHSFSYTVASSDTYTNIAAGLVAAINGTNTGGSGEKLSLAGAGKITASNAGGVITLTAENKGVDSNFNVAISTQNAAAVAEQRVYEVAVETAYTEGQKARFSFGANNEIEVSITAEMAAMTAAEQAIAITSDILSRGSELQGVTLSAHSTSTSKIVATSSTPGVALTFDRSRSDGVDATAQAQVSKLTVGGYIGKGDVFTFSDATPTAVSVSVDDAIAQLDTNEERQAAVRDLLLSEMRADSTLSAAYTMTADGNSGILVEAKVAGTAFSLANSTTSNMSSSIANQAKIETLTLSGDAEEGDSFTVDLGQGSAVTYTATAADASGATAADRLTAVRNGLLAAAADAFGATLDVTADGSAGIRLTAKQAGIDFRAVASVQNAADIAQIESVTFENVEAGDAFTLTIGSESVSYIAASGDTASSVSSWMASNGSFSGKTLSVDANGALLITGEQGQSFAVSTSTENFAGARQSSALNLSGTVETGDIYTATINGKDVSVAVSAAMSSMNELAAAMVEAVNSDTDLNGLVEATLGANGGLVISSRVDGQSFTAQATVSDVGRSRNSVAQIDISTEAGANAAKSVVADALKQVNATRSVLGAVENRLNHTINNLGNVAVNTAASQSRIQDTDFAAATSELAKAQIMAQASTAMLAQANAAKQSVLSLLQ